MRRKGEAIIDLTLSNPTSCGIDYPERKLISALAQPEALHYAPNPKGISSARRAIAEYYREKNVPVDPAHLILTASTSEAYSIVFRLLCEPGDEILVPVPSYPLFEFLAQLNDVVVRPYHLRYDGEWHIDVTSVQHAVTARTRAVVLIHPHNPTGMFLKEQEIEAISGIAEEHAVALVIDEVFADYAFAPDSARVQSTAEHSDVLTFTLNGISKLAGLPQMKLGWIVVSGPAEDRTEALARLEIIADTYLSVNTPVQVALPRLLESGAAVRDAIRRRTSCNLNTLQKLVTHESECTLLQSEGGWYGILQVPRTRTGEEWAMNLLRERNVYVHPGFFFDFEQDNVLVLSLLPKQVRFEEGARRIVEYIGRN